MRRSIRNTKRSTTANSTAAEQLPKPTTAKKKHKEKQDDSSSESDIENYLQPADQIDLTSSFFQVGKSDAIKSFDDIENDIFADTNRLSDSESESDKEICVESKKEDSATKVVPHSSKLNFEQLHNYTKQIEEAKQMVQKYEARKKETQKLQNDSMDDDITNLLSLGEMKVNEPEGFRKSIHSSDFESCSDSDKEDWHEVEEAEAKPSSSVPKEGVQITVAMPDTIKKKKGVDLVASMKRRLNRIKKENQILIHKVHLLCWIAHGNYINKVLNGEGLLALSLSLIPSQHCYPPQRTDLSYLEQIVNWYKKTISVVDKQISKQWSLEKVLKLQLTRKQAYNKKMLVYIFICILRSLGIQCRLVLSFQVLPLRPPNSELHSLSAKALTNSSDKIPKQEVKDLDKKSPDAKKAEETVEAKDKTTTKGKRKSNVVSKNDAKVKKSNTAEKTVTDVKQKPAKEPVFKKDSKDGQRVNTKNPLSKNELDVKNKKPNLSNLKVEKVKKDGESNTKKSERNKSKEPPKRSSRNRKITQLDGADDSSDDETTKKKPNLKRIKTNETPCVKNHPRRLKSLPNYKDAEEESDDDFKANSKNNKDLKKGESKRSSLSSTKTRGKGDVKDDIVSIMKNRIKEEKERGRAKLAKSRKSKKMSDDDSDYAPEAVQKKYHSDEEFLEEKVKVKRRVNPKGASEPEEKKKKGDDVWIEVFLEAEEKWISVDVVKGAVHCVSGLYSRASHPISYIITWNNNHAIKDVTQRYCPNWNTTTRKLRIDSKWWTETLRPYIGQKTARDKEEDEDLARLQLEKPLPTTISEYKNHPLYVLKRHLLKFEALYPPDPPPLGFIRNEPVYARECVHVLHSREIWMKHAKVVKLGEKPYKIVKARPKYDKLSGKTITDLPLEVFGNWQIDDYIPPTAENGIVPKSAYGSVELFKPCMLPKGTVHLKLPGLNKVARKLNIDTAPALIGFDFHSGWNHPIYDGYVVCEEFEETLVAAWHVEQEEQEKRELEKLEKRVYGNWKKLIKGLLIRERLNAKYNFKESSQSEVSKGTKRKTKGPRFVSKKRRICSDSESD
ncbi:hypothetical protein RN001_000296 [Aquatica leii]|uniref:DNA repair protein complementing XP-C cells homolog n=1 Tax=Aquatica leii TaxID=1421715 RepID=A0AAN7SSF1_9COLE|nr:hypothetical protein RN001_000296 [Aquatica leii]